MQSISPLMIAGGAAASSALVYLSYYLVKAGLFRSVTCRVTESPKLKIAYKMNRGDYQQSGPIFEAHQKDCGITNCHNRGSRKFFGLYFDDPYKVAKEKLRFATGIVLEEDNDEVLSVKLKELGYTFVDFPAAKAVHTDFPCTGMLSMLLAISRVYGKIYSFVEVNKLMPQGKAPLCFEIYGQDSTDFYVAVDSTVDLDIFALGQSTEGM